MTAIIRVSVIQADGSAPRDAGTFMTVTDKSFTGTIGGGALENAALVVARHMLGEKTSEDWRRQVKDYPLGPDLAQCCGGYVRLMFEAVSELDIKALNDATHGLAVRPLISGPALQIVTDRKTVSQDWPLALQRVVRDMLSGAIPSQAMLCADDWYVEPLAAELTPLYLYGAGHVGRAVVHALTGLPFDIHWVDTDTSRFPDDIPAGVHRVVSDTPANIPGSARAGAFHVVMTFSHVIDFDICQGVLARGDFAYLGLIGSKTKRARFAKRLRDVGLSDAHLHSPIGMPGLDGKEPAVIAISLAADLLVRLADRARSTLGNSDVIEGGTG